MDTQPDNLEPWQLVARELGTFVETDESPYSMMEQVRNDTIGDWMLTEPACREIARLRDEIEELERDNRNMDARIRGDND